MGPGELQQLAACSQASFNQRCSCDALGQWPMCWVPTWVQGAGGDKQVDWTMDCVQQDLGPCLDYQEGAYSRQESSSAVQEDLL